MKVDALAQLAAQSARGGLPSLVFNDDGDFASKLTLGQIIKGRVLRSEEGGARHLVDFGGRQRTVDSSVPLRPDEVFHGRVVGLGEQVQLQKLGTPAANDAVAVDEAPAAAARLAGSESLAMLFERYRAALPPAQVQAATTAVARSADPRWAAIGALVLAKLSLPLDPGLIRALHARLVEGGSVDPARGALQMTVAAAALPPQTDAAVPALASALAAALEPRGAQADAGGDHQRDEPRARDAAWRVLNLQGGSAVAHRLGTLALVVDGRLVELDVALFDERGDERGRGADGDEAAAAMRHRQLVISIDTAALGRVEVRARIAGSRMDVALATPSSEQTLQLSLHSARLGAALAALGFDVDGMAYETRAPAVPGGAVRATVEHLINPGSVSRWA